MVHFVSETAPKPDVEETGQPASRPEKESGCDCADSIAKHYIERKSFHLNFAGTRPSGSNCQHVNIERSTDQ